MAAMAAMAAMCMWRWIIILIRFQNSAEQGIIRLRMGSPVGLGGAVAREGRTLLLKCLWGRRF